MTVRALQAGCAVAEADVSMGCWRAIVADVGEHPVAYLVRGKPLHVANSSQYWCPYYLVVTVEGPEGARSVTTARPFARIGAHESADVLLPQSDMPRRALYLHATHEGVFWVNLAEVTESEGPLRGWLETGRAIPLGAYRISARLERNGSDVMSPPLDLCAKGTIPGPLPALSVAFDDEVVARRKLSRRLTLVGRRRPSTLRISSQDLSASHLVLYWDAGRIWAVDLLSRTGTKLDGEVIEATPFPVGSSLIAGEVKLMYEQRSTEAPSSYTDSTIALETAAPPEDTASSVSSSVLCNPLEKTLGDSSAVLSLSGSSTVLGHSLRQREKLRLEREQWLREQAEREAEWQRRLEELDAGEAAFLARQQAREAALNRRAAQLEQWQAELDSARARLTSRTRAREAPEAAPIVRSGNGPTNRSSSDEDPEARQDEVMDRLFRVSRAKRSWWRRFRSAFWPRSSQQASRERAESSDSNGD